MGPGVDPLRAAYGAGLAAPLPPQHALLVVVVALYAAFFALAILYLALELRTRRGAKKAEPVRSEPVAEPARSQTGWPGVHELRRAELLRMLLARLARLAALDARPEVRTNPGMRRLARAAILSTYRDCEALGAGSEARAVLLANGHEMRPGSKAENA